jgi:hypothetical protein
MKLDPLWADRRSPEYPLRPRFFANSVTAVETIARIPQWVENPLAALRSKIQPDANQVKF